MVYGKEEAYLRTMRMMEGQDIMVKEEKGEYVCTMRMMESGYLMVKEKSSVLSIP